MNWLSMASSVVLILFGFGASLASPPAEEGQAEVVEIPLEQIWAYGMPGTKDVRRLVAASEQISQPIGIRVGGPPSFVLHKGEKIAGPGFAVLGTGKEALLATHSELPAGEKYGDTFPFGREISLVFFSHGFGRYVHIHQVERQRNTITIRYRFVPHRTRNMSSHFALIPVDELCPGKVQVNIVRSPMEEKDIDSSFKPVSAEEERRIVCKSFSFTVLPKENQ